MLFDLFAPAWLQSTVAFLKGWATVDMIVGCAAVAVAVFETWIINSIPAPINKAVPDLRKWAICVAIVAFTLTGAIAYGFNNGLNEKQRQWDISLQRETIDGEKDRADSERTIGPVSTDRRVFDNDPDNRDRDGASDRKQSGERPQSALRRLAPHSLFGK